MKHPSATASVTERRPFGRAVLSFLVVAFFACAQFILIFLGWQAAVDALCATYPNHPVWLESRFVRFAGVFFALFCIIYPVYFGMFRLGFQVRRQLDEQQSIPK